MFSTARIQCPLFTKLKTVPAKYGFSTKHRRLRSVAKGRADPRLPRPVCPENVFFFIMILIVSLAQFPCHAVNPCLTSALIISPPCATPPSLGIPPLSHSMMLVMLSLLPAVGPQSWCLVLLHSLNGAPSPASSPPRVLRPLTLAVVVRAHTSSPYSPQHNR